VCAAAGGGRCGSACVACNAKMVGGGVSKEGRYAAGKRGSRPRTMKRCHTQRASGGTASRTAKPTSRTDREYRRCGKSARSGENNQVTSGRPALTKRGRCAWRESVAARNPRVKVIQQRRMAENGNPAKPCERVTSIQRE